MLDAECRRADLTATVGTIVSLHKRSTDHRWAVLVWSRPGWALPGAATGRQGEDSHVSGALCARYGDRAAVAEETFTPETPGVQPFWDGIPPCIQTGTTSVPRTWESSA
ncbi:hypothetical protein [Amycolatopsis sp. cmx-11-51]|uniref:hypothetical protein n=1 Tax=Amycolatopsis sp. cmx-11-51 TaxID=2785797 RepID=UPI0039E58E75